MASAVGGLRLILPVFLPAGAATLAYGAYRVRWRTFLQDFLTGPGRMSRIMLLLFVVFNWKSMPLAWTVRIFSAFLRHSFRERQPLPPSALFHPLLTRSHTSLLEMDYNMHKSNATYFSDLDVARSHLVTYLLRPGLKQVADNARRQLVRGADGAPVGGDLGIGLGGVAASFRREMAPYAAYEMWSRVLAWDRKWLYIVTHYVEAGRVRPASWDVAGTGADAVAAARAMGPVREGSGEWDAAKLQQRHVYATAISKYVFKLGRFTVHPAIALDASGLLPPRPDGWRGGPEDVGVGADDIREADVAFEDWDWRRTEWERQEGMKYARHFAALDGMQGLFDGGEMGALGRF